MESFGCGRNRLTRELKELLGDRYAEFARRVVLLAQARGRHARKGKPGPKKTPGWIAKIAEGNHGKRLSEETRARIGVASRRVAEERTPERTAEIYGRVVVTKRARGRVPSPVIPSLPRTSDIHRVMKITRRQLFQIIREEARRLAEAASPPPDVAQLFSELDRSFTVGRPGMGAARYGSPWHVVVHDRQTRVEKWFKTNGWTSGRAGRDGVYFKRGGMTVRVSYGGSDAAQVEVMPR
jgi:hypothetical protein